MKGKMGIFKQSKIQIMSLISLVAMILLLILGGNIVKLMMLAVLAVALQVRHHQV